MEADLNSGGEVLLGVEPQELKFNIELGKQSSCTIRLTNSTKQRVAFKVMATSPKKYSVRPNVGIISPKSSLDVNVTMRALTETAINTQCKDKFLVKSVIASSADSVESARRMFNEKWRPISQCRLKVVYNIPSDQPPSDNGISDTVSSPHLPPSHNGISDTVSSPHQPSSHNRISDTVFSPNQPPSRNGISDTVSSSNTSSSWRERDLDDSEVRRGEDRNGTRVLDYFKKAVTVGLVCLIALYLIVKLLPLIWSLTFMLLVLVVKMVKKLVSDSAEDWIVKTLLYAVIHFGTFLFGHIFGRRQNNNENES